MPTFLYVGSDPRDYPAYDGLHPSFTVQPGGHVDADTSPDPARFDPVDACPDGNPRPTAATITETPEV